MIDLIGKRVIINVGEMDRQKGTIVEQAINDMHSLFSNKGEQVYLVFFEPLHHNLKLWYGRHEFDIEGE